jgi:hypothetical protein
MRPYEITAMDGTRLVSGYSAWLLVHYSSHRIIRTKDFTLRPPVTRKEEHDCPYPGKLALPENLESLGEHIIGNSEIDANGHVNSSRYGALTIDALPEKYAGKEFFFGSVTDPYNPQEETYRRTRTLLEQLQGKCDGIKISIQTKSDLVLRDIDLIKTFPNARVGFSINTLDESFKNDMDRAVSIERRLAAMKKLHDEGVRTTCFISPIFPGITDVPAIIDRVKKQCNLVRTPSS